VTAALSNAGNRYVTAFINNGAIANEEKSGEAGAQGWRGGRSPRSKWRALPGAGPGGSSA